MDVFPVTESMADELLLANLTRGSGASAARNRLLALVMLGELH